MRIGLALVLVMSPAMTFGCGSQCVCHGDVCTNCSGTDTTAAQSIPPDAGDGGDADQ
jgi:hypothetical protein